MGSKSRDRERGREMERNREARRVPMAAAGNGFSRRRHRAGSFRDSSEEDGPVELPEAARLRDRGGSTKKDGDRERERDGDRERERERERERDRLNSRSKRRRERLIMMQGNMDDGDGETSEETVNDDEEYDGGGGGVGPPSSIKMLPRVTNISTVLFSSALSNLQNGFSGNLHHQRKSFPPTKVFRSSPSPVSTPPVASSWKAVDEMIGMSVPRKARSASTKRSHESWASSANGRGVFASAEQVQRQISTSPARDGPASMLASPSPPAPPSPSSSNVLVRNKMTPGPKQKPSSSSKPLPPVAAQDEIEIEIAEVLYGMMRQPQGTSKQESAGNDSGEIANSHSSAKPTAEVKFRLSSPIFNLHIAHQSSISLGENSSSSAPKRKKPRHEEENINTVKAEEEGEVSGSTGENIPVMDVRESKQSKSASDEQPEKKENCV